MDSDKHTDNPTNSKTGAPKIVSASVLRRISQYAVSPLSMLCHKIELNKKTSQKFTLLLVAGKTKMEQ